MGLREKVAEVLCDQVSTSDTIDAVMEVVEGRDVAIRELHQPYMVTDNPMDLCRTCDTIHPCPTLRALGEET